LVIFPSPYGQGGKLGVRAVYLADAIYENQTNLREAKRVVDAVVEHIATRPNESLGIVTLNIKQRDLIAELLEERLKSVRGADSYREHWATEGARRHHHLHDLRQTTRIQRRPSELWPHQSTGRLATPECAFHARQEVDRPVHIPAP
jgi:G3E family GTPase